MTQTKYYLARTPQDYRKCHSLLRKLDSEFQDYTLSFPTIMAIRDKDTEDERLIGFLSTSPRKDALVAEPLALDVEGNAAFLYVRLAEQYESLLRAAGATFYMLHIPHEYDEYIRVVKRFGLKEEGQDEIGVWFRRDIDGVPSKASSSTS